MLIDAVKSPVVTSKSVMLSEIGQYTFRMDARITKTQIKQIIQDIYKVSVVAVNTHRLPRKKRRVGGRQGFKNSYKHVIVRLKAGETIDLFGEQAEKEQQLQAQKQKQNEQKEEKD
jgi:large subunit ribosomal protein L23